MRSDSQMRLFGNAWGGQPGWQVGFGLSVSGNQPVFAGMPGDTTGDHALDATRAGSASLRRSARASCFAIRPAVSTISMES